LSGHTDMNGEPIAWIYIPLGKPIPSVWWNTVAKRFTNFVRYFAVWYDESVFIEARNRYWVREEVLACIGRSETTLWLANKSTGNIMNYGNNDRWDTRDYAHVLDNVMAAAHWIADWKYMWGNTILWEMSQWWRIALWLPWCSESSAPNKCYATSEENWRRNMHNCLTFMYWEKRDRDKFAVKKVLYAHKD
jgi:hypothetical protein